MRSGFDLIYYTEYAKQLSMHVTEAVRPFMGHLGRDIVHTGSSGDRTFKIDQVAEIAIQNFVLEMGRPVQVFTEDIGMKEYNICRGKPEAILLLDPVDGSRPAIADFEHPCVSIAVLPFLKKPTLADVAVGVVEELNSRDKSRFVGVKGDGVSIESAGISFPLTPLSVNTDINRMFWSYEFAQSPQRPLMDILAGLIEETTMNSAAFCFGATAFAITRVVTGQTDAHIDIRRRLLTEHRDEFMRIGGGKVSTIQPYDYAASYLIAKERGCTVSDELGNPIGGSPLFAESEGDMPSLVVSANPVLHRNIIEYLTSNF